MLQRVAACCSVLQRVAVCCSMLQHVAACCSVLQRVAVWCSAASAVIDLVPIKRDFVFLIGRRTDLLDILITRFIAFRSFELYIYIYIFIYTHIFMYKDSALQNA